MLAGWEQDESFLTQALYIIASKERKTVRSTSKDYLCTYVGATSSQHRKLSESVRNVPSLHRKFNNPQQKDDLYYVPRKRLGESFSLEVNYHTKGHGVHIKRCYSS